MAELIKDPKRRIAMGKRARYRAETDFQESKYVESHLELIQSIQSPLADAGSAPAGGGKPS
jgi:hypothetical protein